MTIRRSRRKTTGDDDPPPRPANKFILFRLAKCKEMEQASEALCGGTLQQRHLSVDLGEAWNALPVDEKNRKRMHSCRSISVGTRITSPLQTGRSAGGGWSSRLPSEESAKGTTRKKRKRLRRSPPFNAL
ncbi:hypothetical protein BN946_scf184985.g43 [Trametes cinnabarina]|uniref:HMG box domain-containing protein n=1 Tax=Pycnoporus cinnabarinus TaxID=5643 RepID=A0A060SK60_PYCCI|nr:hypothetical protein BN946_scf184985.g43 [Trametes cinnabarina]